jgi:hypothetical protein
MSTPQPFFILASPRSFTSLTCGMLGQHPDLFGVPELNLFYTDTIKNYLQIFKDEGQLRKTHGLHRVIAQLYTGEQTIESIQLAHRWLINRSHCTTGEIYWELCEKVRILRIVDKSPAYSLFSESLIRIRETFPEAYFLHLVRHPRAQGESVMNLVPDLRYGKNAVKGIFGPPKKMNPTMINSLDIYQEKPILDYQFLWYRMQTKIMEFMKTIAPERQMFLRGEDVLGDPRHYFKLISDWLGISWSEEAYEAMLHPEDSPFSSPGPWGAQFGNDPNFMKNPVFRPRNIKIPKLEGPLPWRSDGKGFSPKVMDLARELGYD